MTAGRGIRTAHRVAALLPLLVWPAMAQAQLHPVPPPVGPVAPSRHHDQNPWDNPSPALIEAMTAARRAELLLGTGRLDEAVEATRQAIARSPEPPEPAALFVRSIHVQAVAKALIWARRHARAGELLDAFAARVPDRLTRRDEVVVPIIDLQLYLAAAARDPRRTRALLDLRLRAKPDASCPSQPYFPEVVAPMHHDGRVAAMLKATGCTQPMLDQLDDLTSRPMGAGMADRGLPPHVRR